LALATGQIDEARRQKLKFVLEENRVYRVLHRALDEYLATLSPNATIRDWTMSSLFPTSIRVAGKVPFTNPNAAADCSTFIIVRPPDPLLSSKTF
jgi:hypothetical protein